ncbi:MAG: tetratricopeptide repeat protein [Phycisphaerales bacterium]
MAHTRTGKVGAGGLALVVVLIVGLGVAGWALWSALGGPAPATAEERPGDGSSGGPDLAPPDTFEVIVRAAREHVREGNPAAAEAVLAEGVAQYPDDQQLRIELAELMVNAGRMREAYDQMIAALAIGPRTADLEFQSGTIAGSIGETELAVEHFVAAQTANPAEPKYALYLATAQSALGETEAAEANLVRVTVLDPGNAVAWGQLAELALRSNRSELAMQHARRARDADPGEPAWRLIEARAMKRAGQAEQALGVLLALDPDVLVRPEYAKTAAESLGMLGRTGEAAELYERAHAADDQNPQVAFDAALWAERAGNTDRALELARYAQRLGHEHAARVVERLTSGG